MEINGDVIPRIASGFGGGIGNSGAVCGAVAGAIMAIGLRQKTPDTMEDVLRNLADVREFRRRFETEFGTINCSELTGMDLSTEEGVEEFMGSDIPQTVCMPTVDAAYQLAVEKILELA